MTSAVSFVSLAASSLPIVDTLSGKPRISPLKSKVKPNRYIYIYMNIYLTNGFA